MSQSEGDYSGVRIPPPLVYLAGLAVGFLLQRWWSLALVTGAADAVPVRDLGFVLIAAAVALAGWAVGSFRSAGTSVNPTKPSTTLVIRGPYRISRNPMYVALALLHVGVAFAANALWPFVMLAPALAIIRYHVIAREEAYMTRKFGTAYEDYCRRVRRWL